MNQKWRTTVTVFMIAFLQGLIHLYSLPLFYYYKDKLKATTAELSFLTTMVSLPWSIKPIFGYLSDQYPLFGSRRKSYLIITSILEMACLAYIAYFAETITQTFICQTTLVSLLVFRNVIGVTKQGDDKGCGGQAKAQKSVSVFFGSRAFGALVGSYFTGMLAQSYPHATSFMLCGFFSLLLILVSIFVFEEAQPDNRRQDEKFSVKVKKITEVVLSPKIRTVLIIVLLLIMHPNLTSVFNYYLTQELHFEKAVMGEISFLSSLAYLTGILAMNTVFAGADFKSFYAVTTLFTGVMSSTSLVLIFRLNVKYGISDQLFCLSNSALTTFISELNSLPILAFICRLCPEGLEGSTYAVFTAIMNFGYNSSLLFGSLLVWVYQVTKADFTNLWKLVVIQVIYSLFFGLVIWFVQFPDNEEEVVQGGGVVEGDEEREELIDYHDFERGEGDGDEVATNGEESYSLTSSISHGMQA